MKLFSALKVLLISAASMSILAGPARADEQTRVDDFFAQWQAGEWLPNLDHLAKCTSERFPELARSYVMNAVDPDVLMQRREEFASGKCVKAKWFKTSATALEPNLFQQMLAENLLLIEVQGNSLPDVSAVSGPNNRIILPDISFDAFPEHYARQLVVEQAVSRLAEASECVSRREPAEVLALLSTDRSSAQESEALRALDASFVDCGSENLKVRVPDFVRRGTLVLELYRLTVRQRAQPIKESA